MLKPEMIEKLNEQMNLELYSSLLYQQMSAWCSYHTFEGAAAFLRRHAQEEMTHMQRLFDYLTDTGNLPRINTVESPFAEYSSLDELFQETYKHEQLITQKINELAHAAMTNQDYPTFNFLQWYVSEQHEEEKLFKSIIDKLSLAAKAAKVCILSTKNSLPSTHKTNALRRQVFCRRFKSVTANLTLIGRKTVFRRNKFAFCCQKRHQLSRCHPFCRAGVKTCLFTKTRFNRSFQTGMRILLT